MAPESSSLPLHTVAPGGVPAAGGTPRVADGIVPRPRLLRRLAGAGGVPLVLVVAPAGYGKTTLLAEWAARDERRFAWLRPGAVAAAGTAARTLERLTAGGPAVVVVDDADRAPAAAIAELAEAAGRLRAGSVLALASRRRLGAPVARLRAHRLALTLGMTELAMTRLEAALLFSSCGLRLDGEAVDRLVARTEGWPAALAIAAQALAEQPRPADAARAFGGTDRLVAEYVRSELLATLPAHRVAFLRRTAIAEELSPSLCDALLGRGDAGRTLEALAREDVGLEPADRVGGAYRLHALVRELLHADLERLEPGLAPELHRRAAAWHAGIGEPEPALWHAVAAGDHARAGHVLWSVAPAEAAAGRAARVTTWLRPFGARELGAHPELAMSAAAVHLAEGRREEAERWTATAERAARRVARGPERTAGLALLRACAATGGVAAMGADAARAAALMPAGSTWHALATLLQGVARHLPGDREAARSLLGRAIRPEPEGIALVRALAGAQLALLDAEAGDWDAAAERAGAARAELAGLERIPPPAVIVLAADAVAGAHHGDAADARRAAAAAHELLADDAGLPPWLAVEAQVWLARAEIRLSDAAAARALLARAARLLGTGHDAPLLAAWLHDGWERADAFAAGATGELPALTNAELRVLRFLPSHLSFREIGDRLHISANTVKTQALSAYRKLDVGSRSEAVSRGRAVGLIDG